MPAHRSLDQQREQALRRALEGPQRKRPVSADARRRAMAAFEVRQSQDTPMVRAIEGTLRQYPVARQVQPRGTGRVRPGLWLGLGVACELGAASMLGHSVAWCATFASFGLATSLYGITLWPKGLSSGVPANDRDDWMRAGQRYDQAWTTAHALPLPEAAQQRLHALHATLLRLLPLALNPSSHAWSLEDRVSLESTIGDYLPEAVRGYQELAAPTSEGLESLERQLDQLQERLAALERTVVQRGYQRQQAHERFLDQGPGPSETHL